MLLIFLRQHERAHAAFLVVITGLQQVGGLARIHGRVIEIEFGHGRALSHRLAVDAPPSGAC